MRISAERAQERIVSRLIDWHCSRRRDFDGHAVFACNSNSLAWRGRSADFVDNEHGLFGG